MNAQIYTVYIIIIFLLGWLCGAWGGSSSLDFIFSSEVDWPQNDKDAFPQPIKRLQCCCYHVTLTALRRLTAGLRLSQRCVSWLRSMHTCTYPPTHTHTHKYIDTTRPPDQNKYMTKVLIHEVCSIEVDKWQAGNTVNCSPLFLTTESACSVTPEGYDFSRVVRSNDLNTLWAIEPLLWLLLSKLRTTVEKGDLSHFLFCRWSLTLEWGLGLIVWSKWCPKKVELLL